MRDPKAMLLHPDYSDFGSQDKTKAEIFPDLCIRAGHGPDLCQGHVVSKSTLKLIDSPKGQVTVLYTCYDDTGRAYIPAGGYALLHNDSATTAPAFCETCEGHFKSADGLPDVSRNVDLRRALHEACTRNAHHVIWRLLLFNKKLDGLKRESKLPDLLGLRPANERIIELARDCLPPLPDDPIPAGTPLEHDGHFRHFTRQYPNIEFKVAVSTEVVLQHENDPATQALAFINVMPQKADSEAGWHTAAALSIPRTAPSVWDAILDNSAHSDNFSELAHQLLISNLATRSPDGVCFAPAHFGALSRETGIWEAGILPNLMENPFPGLCLPVVNVIGSDLSSLANCSFNLFA